MNNDKPCISCKVLQNSECFHVQFDDLSSATATGVGVYSAADVDGIRLLLFQSQEAKHAWNLSEL